MLAIPLHSQSTSMAEIVSKEAQKKSKAGICSEKISSKEAKKKSKAGFALDSPHTNYNHCLPFPLSPINCSLTIPFNIQDPIESSFFDNPCSAAASRLIPLWGMIVRDDLCLSKNNKGCKTEVADGGMRVEYTAVCKVIASGEERRSGYGGRKTKLLKYIKLLKQTESVNKEVHNKLLKSFAKLENHSISLELALQKSKEQMKNNSVCKENGSNVFRKEHEQYHEIQDLKAQMQDKNIAISELKKLIEKCKGKYVETQVDKPSVTRQPNAQRIPKPSVLEKPTPFLNSLEMRMKFNHKEVEEHHRISSISRKTKSVTACNDSSKSRTSNVNAVCAECGKCVFNSNHDACVSRYLNDVNARTKNPKVVPISASKPKSKANKFVATPHKKTVASDTTIQQSKSYHKELYENTNQEWKWWIAKRCPSGYKWIQKPLRTKKIWMPKIRKEDVSTSISPTIDIVSRITNVLKISNSLGSNLSNVPSPLNSSCNVQLILSLLTLDAQST
ncbi:hypothetical protein Tco_0290411 [Tanacetum coccineum]